MMRVEAFSTGSIPLSDCKLLGEDRSSALIIYANFSDCAKLSWGQITQSDAKLNLGL